MGKWCTREAQRVEHLDYFIVDQRIAPAIMRATRLTGFGIAPHTPVRLAISSASPPQNPRRPTAGLHAQGAGRQELGRMAAH